MSLNAIFVEGMDCVGKSTIIKDIMLSHEFYHHFEFPKGDSIEEKYGYQHGQFEMMFQMLNACKYSNNEDYIFFDRSHIGEYIWGPTFRNRFPMYLTALEHKYKNLSAMVVLLINNNLDEIAQRFEERGEKMPDNWKELQDKFLLAVKTITPFRYNIIDTTNKTLNQIKEELETAIEDSMNK